MRVEKKLTIDQIAERLALSRSTIYYWVNDLPIPYMSPGRQAVLPKLRKGNLRMQERYRRKREEAYAQGAAEFDVLCSEPTFRDFVALYIAEGSKRDRNSVAICNSDPAVLSLAFRWMKRMSDAKFDYCVQYHADQKPEDLASFWATQLGIEPDDVKFQRKSNSNQLKKRTWRSQYGVLTIRARDTLLRARLQAWIDCIREHWLDSASRGA